MLCVFVHAHEYIYVCVCAYACTHLQAGIKNADVYIPSQLSRVFSLDIEIEHDY